MSHLRDRGLSRTAQVGLSAWRDRHFDGVGGFDTRTCDDLHTRKRQIPALQDATIYAPTRARPLSHLLRALNVPPDAVFVDLGCGKGRALIVAAQYGVRRLKGIELVPEFIRSCETNLQKVLSRGGNLEWQILNIDIRDYAVSPEDDVFYLYDPCAWSVVLACLSNILASWREHPRRFAIYHLNLSPSPA
jgi:SAM-dependent methyltransferase